MIKQASLLKWSHSGSKREKNVGKHNWIHHSDALKNGHVAYLVKFLGTTEVDQPKGIEVVKEGIRKMKFNQHLKRAEGSKTPKVELTISIDGVAVQDPKLKKIMYQYPLHRISYCADDKSDKKFFSFIAKDADNDTHSCFVFVSDKLAEEITLTIGQAFDLAYRRFLETSGRDLEMKKQLMILQKKFQELEKENAELKAKLSEYENKNGRVKSAAKVATVSNGVHNGSSFSAIQPPPQQRTMRSYTSNSQSVNLLDLDSQPTVGTKLENLCLDDDDFDPRACDTITNGTTNGHTNGHLNNRSKDVFGCDPFTPNCSSTTEDTDPFGMGKFETKDLDEAIGNIDKKLAEMRDGFSRGLSFGNDDFSVEALDPLNQKN
ncbi:PTB domain-containing engulfment adapter protein 1-like protein [Leptotrombidium deliense]|uniref:PTB domain-containing engulfment adapter protein 1-like protein n=1 Tax=Leptotrombidium deliense TaxID=299467 RepID=A0A443SVR2_9ACAR|nr:PTB domain-containing engulfment adapter protein 1-like protein [Leptotrombidium deliense]